MSVQWIDKGRRRRIAALAAALVALPQLLFKLALPWYPTAYLAALAAAMGGFAWLALSARIEVRAWWGVLIEQACVAVISAAVLHLPMFQFSRVVPMAFVYTACIALTLQLLCFAATGNGKWFCAVWLTLCLIYGIVSVEVLIFTDNMITLGQILSVRTGINVMGSYRFVFAPFIISATLLYACAMYALLRLREAGAARPRNRALAVALALAAAVTPAQTYRTRSATTYADNCLRAYGIPMELLLEIKSLHVRPPEGYSADAVARLGAYSGGEAATGETPHVIAVMLEAFSDLSVLGELQTDADPLAYTRTLWSESIHGSYLASTLAGGTSRTEWEYLTGNSMYFMPSGSIPFRQYVTEGAHSIVRVFKDAGYHTIGMHPFSGNGWDRNRVYPIMGFDEIYFESDLDWDGRVRGYVSDSAFVHQVIERFEARDPSAPLFLFGVSMQNHGGYAKPNFEATVHVQGLNVDCSEENQYLSLVKLTDDAIRELVEYFRGVDEPVALVFFGDHQPGLTQPFYDALGVEQYGYKFIVPYVIWKNYDDTPEEATLTSANYLAARTLKEAGLALPAYYGFLDAMSEAVPVVCGNGYQYDGAFYPKDEIANETAGAWLWDYAVYQYANVFDRDADGRFFE